DAKNREQVEEQIADCAAEARRQDDEAAARRAVESAAAAAAATPAPAAEPPAAAPESARKRWPLWVGIAVGAAAVVAGGITAGVLLGRAETPSLGLENAR